MKPGLEEGDGICISYMCTSVYEYVHRKPKQQV